MKSPIIVTAILSVLLVGCGGKSFVPADGKVVFEDGSPLMRGDIAFSTDTFMATGTIREDGTFVLSSVKPDDGLPPGEYIVTISSFIIDEKDRTIHLIDPSFSDQNLSHLRASVAKKGTNRFDFTVKKPAK